MKKLALLLLASAALNNASAQVPAPLKENKGMFAKISATWCGPCGAWGWTLMDGLISTNANDIPISFFPSSSDGAPWQNLDFYNATNVTFSNAISFTGYPSYSANFVDKSAANTSGGSVNTAGVTTDVNAALASFRTAPVVASTGYTYKIVGNNITVDTKTKFWAAASGNYYLAVLLLENAKHIQNSQSGVVQHHGVLRASMSTNVWGEQIATGSIAANAEYTKSYTFTVTDTKWDKTLFHPVVVLFKQNGSKYDYVNGNDKYGFATSVANVGTMQNVSVYPNPATEQATVAVSLDKAADVNITLVDAVGRVVYNSGNLQFGTGVNAHFINTSSLAAGVYNVNIQSEGNVETQRLSVVK
eukprot:TRINITY_DN19118_c0_g1_i1.p1 TRINITY_DN19118_c0_g1~~TRINITY_DN19118_c0_g1_i1.p1  ORF type:complete len:359 (-),score=52.87 TRINITY_DN19118_c0_g1_i1:992-2068(-)